MSLIIFLTMNLMMISIIFSNMMQPLTMGIILLIQTFLVSLFSGTILFSYWFSYILMLIFLGAMLILFIYVCSLASNQTFKMSTNITLFMVAFFFLSLTTFLIDPLMINTPYTKMSSFTNVDFSLNPTWMLSMIYSHQCYLMTTLIILYLLLTLIVVVKIVYSFFGPLRLNN